MFCEKCGNKLLEGDRFCPACGNPVDTPDFNSDSSLMKDDLTAGMGYGYPEPEEQPPRKKKDEDWYGSQRTSGKPSHKKKRQEEEDEWEREERKEKITFIVLGVVIVALIVVIVAGILFLLKSDETKENKREPQLTEEQKDELLHKNQQEITPEPTQETTPEAIQETTLEPTQEVTPEPTQEVTPMPTQPITPPPQQPVTPTPTAVPQEVMEADYMIADSNTRYLTNSDLNALSEAQIRIARNEIYARHGRIFKSEDLAEYFASKSWYVPSVPADQFDNSCLNNIEVENLKFITNYEKAHNMNQ